MSLAQRAGPRLSVGTATKMIVFTLPCFATDLGFARPRSAGARLAFVLCLLVAGELRAAPIPLSVTWEESAGCAIERSVADRVATLVGQAGPRAAPVRASIRLQTVAAGYRVTLSTAQLGQSGEREFETASCERAADAIALVLSVMLSPPATAESVKDKGFPGGVQTPKSTGRTPSPQPRPAPTSDAPDLRLGFGPRVGGDIGGLPKPTLFGGAGLWVGLGRVRGEARGVIWVPRDTQAGPRPGTAATVGMWTASLGGCYAIWRPSLWFEACLAGEAGASRGEGHGIQNPAQATALWAAVVPGVTVRGPGSSLPASIAFDLPLVLSRPEYTIDGFGRLYRASLVAVRLSVGADWALP